MTLMTDPNERAPDEEQPPPLLGSWRKIYAVLVLELLAVTAALYALTRWLS
jgi:hypothetical protein